MNENNNVRQSLEAFREKFNTRIKERLNRPTLTEDLHKQNEKQAEKKSPWIAEFRSDKATYMIMAISALFTGALGLILGLAPSPDGSTMIEFHTDFLHIAIAAIYALSFVTVTEAAFIVAKNKFHTREEANPTQHNTMLAMMILAGISIIGTGWAGGSIGASVLGFLTDFKEIPHSAQKWVVGVIPFLLAVYAYLLTAYKLSSEEEKSKRLAEQTKRKQQRDHQLQMDMAELEVEEMMMLAESKAYIDAVERGVLSAGEAQAAKRAGKTLRQLEAEKGKDLNGDGIIEKPAGPAPVSRTPIQASAPGAPDDYGPLWKSSTDITPILDPYAWVCLNCDGSNQSYTRKCQWCDRPRTNESPLTAFADRPPATTRANGNGSKGF